MDRWGVYEALKGNNRDKDVVKEIESSDASEVKEGVIEYLLSKEGDKNI